MTAGGLDLADRIELHELAARYGDAIDERDWASLDEIFAEDAVYDLSELGIGVGELRGRATIKKHIRQTGHPRAHHITNIHVREIDGKVMLLSRILAMMDDRRITSGQYRDEMVRTPAGWRIQRRTLRARGHRTAKPLTIGTKG